MKLLASLFMALSVLCSACAHTQKPSTIASTQASAKSDVIEFSTPSFTQEEVQSPQSPVSPFLREAHEEHLADHPDSIIKVLIKIIGFLVLLSAGACLLVRFLKGGSLQGLGLGLAKAKASQLQIKETRLLGNKQFLLVVEYEGQKMLLGTSPNGLQYLCKLDSPDGKRSEIMKVQE
jgi:flagellar biogenesis protein FliO